MSAARVVETDRIKTAVERTSVLLAAIDAAGIPNDTALLDIREENGYLNVLCPADLRVLLDRLAEVEKALTEARGERPSGFWSQREWEDWSNDLAVLIPEDDVSRYSNPEGAQEGIISDLLAAYVNERSEVTTPPGAPS